ncbi:zinc/iron transporter [Peziza echinospora]|nr:zinc/iron transporter [Peziza echinospora]
MKISQSRRATLFGGRKTTLAIVFAACLFLASTAVAQTDCHSHGTETWCIGPDGKESLYPSLALSTGTPTATSGGVVPSATHDDHNEDEHAGENCHFHAGVEHCENDEAGDFDPATDCAVSDRDYNRGLRIGALFIVLATSSIAVFLPIVLAEFTKLALNGIIFTIIKQFGTGVIVATAFIHLLTHANLMFTNRCIGELPFESTTNAIAMAGIFVSFLVEYIGDRFVQHRANRRRSDNPIVGVSPKEVPGDGGSEQTSGEATNVGGHGHVHGGKDDKVGIIVMEAGIIFHSILVGVTTIVAGDSVFTTLLIVIIFHQMFEGLALGSRISLLPPSSSTFTSKFLMGGAFALITPIGMAIGLGVLNKFNGNDRHTLIAMGTLDSFSAGILLWVGLVEMWAADWLYGDLKSSGFFKTMVGIFSLMAGMVLMGLLGKWA